MTWWSTNATFYPVIILLIFSPVIFTPQSALHFCQYLKNSQAATSSYSGDTIFCSFYVNVLYSTQACIKKKRQGGAFVTVYIPLTTLGRIDTPNSAASVLCTGAVNFVLSLCNRCFKNDDLVLFAFRK